MTKGQLQKELLEEIKPGIKPSDLKKQNKNPVSPSPISIDEGYSSEEEKNIPKAPPLPTEKIKDLQTQITSLKKQLQTYKDFKEADLKIKEKYKETIKELQTENKQLIEKITKLKNQGKNTVKDKQTPKEPQCFLFTCDICDQHKKSKFHLGKVNGLGIDPNKQNKICDYCINKVDIIKQKSEQEYIWE